MTYPEVLANARECIGKYCKACPVCNGVACKNQIPGPGAKGVGDTACLLYTSPGAEPVVGLTGHGVLQKVHVLAAEGLVQHLAAAQNGDVYKRQGEEVIKKA